MVRKSMKSLARISDESLATVTGASGFWFSPVTVAQTNVAGPVVQLALGNGGSVAQAAGVAQSNSVSF